MIAFDDDTVGVLERHRKQQQADREKWDTESVFPHAAKDAAKATAELVPPQRNAEADKARKARNRQAASKKKPQARKHLGFALFVDIS